MRRPAAAILLAAVLATTGCGAGDAGDAPPRDAPADAADAGLSGTFPVTVTDASGRELVFHAPPRRIVSLVPSATGILLALGAGDRLVGRTEHDTASALAALPSVGGGLQPAMETLLVLEPDLVIRFAAQSDPGTAERLDAAGIRHLAVRPDGIGDVIEIVRRLARVVGRPERGRALAAGMEAGLDSVRVRVQGLPRPRVAFVVGGTPPWVAGPGTFVHELIEVAGGENVFRDLDRLYPVVSPEEFVAREIDLVLAAPGASLDPSLAGLPRRAAPPGIQRPGPDLHRVARDLARILHPGAFP